MNYDKIFNTLAKNIRIMAAQGKDFKQIRLRFGVKKNEIAEILDKRYSDSCRDNIILTINKNKKINSYIMKTNNVNNTINKNNCNKEVIVIDTSFLLTVKLWEVEDFFRNNKNVIIPSPVLNELSINNRDKIKNYNTRRIRGMLQQYNIKVEISDTSIELDPTWVKNDDYYILTVCKKLKNQGLNVKLITFDKEMVLKAQCIGIEIYDMDYSNYNVSYKKKFYKKYISTVRDNIKCIVTKKVNKPKKVVNKETSKTIYNFEKPKVFNKTDFIDCFKPEIFDINGCMKLKNTCSTDSVMGVLKLVINKSGKIKESKYDYESSYYDIQNDDKILMFNRSDNHSLEMKVVVMDKDGNFIINKEAILDKYNMNNKNIQYKQFKEAINHAFNKLLKIKLDLAV